MGKMFDNVRAWWNDLADSMSDPAKLANLKIADLEEALSKAKKEAALIVGRPSVLRNEVAKLEKLEKDYTDKITKLVAAAKNGNTDATEIARQHASKLGEVRTSLSNKSAELATAEENSKSWADKIEMLEKALREKRDQANTIGARSAMAKAEVKLGKAMEELGGLGDDTFGNLEARVQKEEQRAAGYSEMSGINSAMKEKKILEDAETDSILKEFGI